MSSLARSLERVERMRSSSKNQQRSTDVSKSDADKSILASSNIPVWPELMLGVPNPIIRSALFGVSTGGIRKYLSNKVIAAVDGIEITYNGEQLNQDDFDLWQVLIHFGFITNKAFEFKVTAYAILKALQKADTGQNRRRLKAQLGRLRGTALTIKTGSIIYIGGLIDEACKDENGAWSISINQKISDLFGPHHFTQLSRAVRYELSGKQLALWLYGFYSSHKKPYEYKVETIHDLCGSEAALMSDFKKDVIKALKCVQKAVAKHHMHFSYSIEGDLIRVEKNFSISKAQRNRKTGRST